MEDGKGSENTVGIERRKRSRRVGLGGSENRSNFVEKVCRGPLQALPLLANISKSSSTARVANEIRNELRVAKRQTLRYSQ